MLICALSWTMLKRLHNPYLGCKNCPKISRTISSSMAVLRHTIARQVSPVLGCSPYDLEEPIYTMFLLCQCILLNMLWLWVSLFSSFRTCYLQKYAYIVYSPALVFHGHSQAFHWAIVGDKTIINNAHSHTKNKQFFIIRIWNQASSPEKYLLVLNTLSLS